MSWILRGTLYYVISSVNIAECIEEEDEYEDEEESAQGGGTSNSYKDWLYEIIPIVSFKKMESRGILSYQFISKMHFAKENKDWRAVYFLNCTHTVLVLISARLMRLNSQSYFVYKYVWTKSKRLGSLYNTWATRVCSSLCFIHFSTALTLSFNSFQIFVTSTDRGSGISGFSFGKF